MLSSCDFFAATPSKQRFELDATTPAAPLPATSTAASTRPSPRRRSRPTTRARIIDRGVVRRRADACGDLDADRLAPRICFVALADDDDGDDDDDDDGDDDDDDDDEDDGDEEADRRRRSIRRSLTAMASDIASPMVSEEGPSFFFIERTGPSSG